MNPVIGVCIAAVVAGVAPATNSTATSKTRKAAAPIDLMWMVAQPSEGIPLAPQPTNTVALRARGARLFTKHCAACHGKRGDGQGPAAPTLAVKATDFTSAIFKVRSTPSGSLPTDADLFGTISRGLHGTEMFPWSRLSERDRWALVQRLKAFSPRFTSEAPGLPFALPTPLPAETDTLQAKGKALYERLRCGACHGATGGGDGTAVQLYQDAAGARAVNIRDFKKGQFLRGSEMQDIYLTLRTGLDGTPMGPYNDLATSDLWALAAQVRNLVQRRASPERMPQPQ